MKKKQLHQGQFLKLDSTLDNSPSVGAGLGYPSRRNFLAGLTALGAGALLPNVPLWAQTPAINARAIDCHHHFASPAYIKALVPKAGVPHRGYTSVMTWANGTKVSEYSAAKDVEDMDEQGVAASLLSCTTPGIWFGDPEETPRSLPAQTVLPD